MAEKGILNGPLGDRAVHVCVDMQRMFGPGFPWCVPWLETITPRIETLCRYHVARTIFTRFIPARSPDHARGLWRRYYRRWAALTLDPMGVEPVRILPELERFVPPARVIDKQVYSPWHHGALDGALAGTGTDTLVITSGETDICVLATLLGAIDRGYRVVLVEDAICSSSDETHDALMAVFRERFSEQLELASLEQLLESWN